MKLESFFWTCIGIFFLHCGGPQTAFSTDHLRTGVLTLPDGNKLVLIGVAALDAKLSARLNFNKLGFKGEDLYHVDPKFILEVNSKGIQKVRSFELETLSPDKIKTSKRTLGLPPVLLDVQNAEQSELQHLTGVFAAGTAKSLGFPIATLTVISTLSWQHAENIRKLRAYYLMEIINKALPSYNQFLKLKTALSDDIPTAENWLRILGEALIIRYNPKSNWAGYHVPREEGKFYNRWRDSQSGNRRNNQAYLVRRANEANLPVLSIDEDFAIVFANTSQEEDKRGSTKDAHPFHGLDSLSQPTNSNMTAATWIPSDLVAFSNPSGPVTLVNFQAPGKLAKNSHRLAKMQVAQELGGSLIPFSNWVIKAVKKGVQYRNFLAQEGKYLDRLQSYGAVLALAETHVHPPAELDEVAEPLFISALNKFGIHYPLAWQKMSTMVLDSVALLAAEEEKMGRLFKAPTVEEFKKEKQAIYHRLKNYLERISLKVISRGPCSLPVDIDSKLIPKRNPIILFMIDGLRPDRFKNAAEEGLLPNLKQLFYDRGTQVESFASRSLTLPSWSTILTGNEPDTHGIRSNTPTSRLMHTMTDNYQDPRKDLLNPKNWMKNRAFQRLEEDQTGEPGRVWLPGYFHRSQTFFNYMPVVNGADFALVELIQDYFKHKGDYVNHIRFFASALDSASARRTAKMIANDHEGKLRLIMNWYASVDEANHYNNRLLPAVYREIDDGVGLLLNAARNHKYLKNATVFLISDHGHSAGYGPFSESSKLYRTRTHLEGTNKGPLLINTGFNLTKFLAGDFAGYKNFDFVVGTTLSPEPKLDSTRLLKEFQIHPFYFSYPKKAGNPTALLDSSGDNLAQIYLKKESDWKNRNNYYDLTHFKNTQGKLLNIPTSFLEIQIPNLMVTHRGLTKKILEVTDRHPVGIFAMPLEGQEVRESLDLFTTGETDPSTREPVLVVSKKLRKSGEYRTGIILTRSDRNGDDFFRYIVLKNFSQDRQGKITGLLSKNPDDDPLEYVGNVENAESFHLWRTDRQWLNASRNHFSPTIIFGLVRALTLAPKYTNPYLNRLKETIRKERVGEIPDFLLTANVGYAFHSSAPLESDHGAFTQEEVRNSFFISSLDKTRFTQSKILREPLFTRDFMSTILEYAGLKALDPIDPLPPTQGISYKRLIESIQVD